MRQTEDNNDNRGIAMMVRFKSSSGVKKRRKIMVYVKGAQFVERAIPGEEVLGTILAVAIRSLRVGLVSV